MIWANPYKSRRETPKPNSRAIRLSFSNPGVPCSVCQHELVQPGRLGSPPWLWWHWRPFAGFWLTLTMWHQCRASCNFIGCRLYRSASSGHRQTKFILGRVHISWTISWACHEPRQRVTLSSLNLSHISQIWGRTSESSVLCYFGGRWWIFARDITTSHGDWKLESKRRRTKGSVVGEEWCQNAAPLRWYTKNVFAQSKMILSRAWLHDTVSCAAWNDARKGVY